jgi:NAD(P)-dependent dehydrogenase (short-subunit alcohol dehydrogenase family)
MFQKTDVSNRDQVQELLGAAQQTFGAIYTDVSNAHMNREDIFKEETDKSAERPYPDMKSIGLNLVAYLYMVKCVIHYFAKKQEQRCQIVLMDATVSYLDSPPLALYSAAKAGVLGVVVSCALRNHS